MLKEDKEHIIISDDLVDNLDLNKLFGSNKKNSLIKLGDKEIECSFLSMKKNLVKKTLTFSFISNDLTLDESFMDVKSISVEISNYSRVFGKDNIISYTYKKSILKVKLSFDAQ